MTQPLKVSRLKVVALIFLGVCIVLSILKLAYNSLENVKRFQVSSALKKELFHDVALLKHSLSFEAQLSSLLNIKIRELQYESRRNLKKQKGSFEKALVKNFSEGGYFALPGLTWKYYRLKPEDELARLVKKRYALKLKAELNSELSELSQVIEKIAKLNVLTFVDQSFLEFNKSKLGDEMAKQVQAEEIGYDEFARASCGNFAYARIKEKDCLIQWFPIFERDWEDSAVHFSRLDLTEGEKFNVNFSNLRGIFVLAIDREKIKYWKEKVLFKALINNFYQRKCLVGVKKLSGGKFEDFKAFSENPDLQKIAKNMDEGFLEKAGCVFFKEKKYHNGPVEIVLARQIVQSNALGKIGRYFILICLLSWVCCIVWIVGNHFIMGRKVKLPLNFQLIVLTFVLVLPAVILGWLIMERYLLARSYSSLKRIVQISEKKSKSFDNGVALYKAWVSAELNRFLDNPEVKDRVDELFEKDKKNFDRRKAIAVVKKISKRLFECGLQMKNVFFLDASNRIVSVFAGSNKETKSFLNQFCSAFFLDSLRRLAPDWSKKSGGDNKDLLIKTQTEEIIGAFRSFLAASFFLEVGHRIESLEKLEGWGQVAYIYHRFFGRNGKIDRVFQAHILFVTLARQYFNNWYNNFKANHFAGEIWAVGLKGLPGWILKPPFWMTYAEGQLGRYRPIYDVLPFPVAQIGVDQYHLNDSVVKTVHWQGQDWLVGAYAGEKLPGFVFYHLIPLAKQFDKFYAFQTRLKLLMLCLVLSAFLLAYYLVRRFLLPILNLSLASREIMMGNLQARINVVPEDLELQGLVQEFNAVADEVQSGSLLKKFVSKGVLDVVKFKEPEIASGKEKVVVLFFRLKNFWRALKDISPQFGVAGLNEFFEVVCSQIGFCGGEINKFIGEKVMAVFYCKDFETPDQAVLNAMKAVVSVVQTGAGSLGELGCEIQVGVVLGDVQSGLIGKPGSRREQTVVGDSVNLAARLCTLPVDEKMLVSKSVERELKNAKDFSDLPYVFKSIEEQKIKGKKEKINIFSVQLK